ncbi:MAG: SDR family NAD(P)-dependent oxidoreductase [Planctomycetota bacterium]|jgi:3-oxoacyl-[acyl-carrier protein] reductase
MDAGLNDSCVLVTGASGGIGQATARAFAAEGCRVALHYHRQAAAAEQLAGELDVPSITIGADLRDEAAVDAMVDAVIARLGRLDSVVVNAGIWTATPAPLHRMSLAQWRETIETDLTSAFLTCRAYLRHLAATPRDDASIVLVASTAALFGEAEHADYAAAKSGMAYGLTLSLKNEIVRLAPRGRVNCVCPGWTETPMAAADMADAATVGRVLATMPLAKIATPEDVARAVVFLSAPRLAGHLSGVILPLAGGMEGRLLHPGLVEAGTTADREALDPGKND